MRRRNRYSAVTYAPFLGALAAGLTIFIAACGDGEGEESTLSVATFCPHQLERSDTDIAERSDGAIIAAGILTRSSDELLLDSQDLADLTEQVDRVLSLIRNDHPELNRIHARDGPIVFGQLVVGLEPHLEDTIHGLLRESPDTVEFVTGNDAFDSLNARLGLSGVESTYDFALLCFSDRLNVPAAAEAYSKVEGIRYAEPDGIVGDGPDADAERKDGTWYVLFRDAWGDCPAGCTGEQLYFFTVTGQEVVEVEEAQATEDADFAELVELVGSRPEATGR